MLNRETIAVVGASQQEIHQQNSLQRENNANLRGVSSGRLQRQRGILGQQIGQLTTPREYNCYPRFDELKIKFGNTNDKRISQRGPITVNKFTEPEHRNQFSIENIPKVSSAHGRNNILSNSLQMLRVPVTSQIEHRNGSIPLQPNAQVISGGPQNFQKRPQEKAVHLRYVSQGTQQPIKIDEKGINMNPGNLNQEKTSQNTTNSHQMRMNMTTNDWRGRKQIAILPSQTIADHRIQTQQIQEKKVLSQTVTTTNQRRVGGGFSSNNVITTSKKNGLAQIKSNTIRSDLKMQQSLHVQSNQSSIVIDGPQKALLTQQLQPATISASIYSGGGGIITSDRDQNVANSKKPTGHRGDYEQPQRKVKITIMSQGSIDPPQQTQPLVVSSRKNIGDCLIQSALDSTSTIQTPVLKIGGGKFGAQESVKIADQKQLNGTGARNQSTQKINQNNPQQKAGLNNSKNLQRVLRTAQMGAQQRSRGSAFDNIWDAPINQNLDLNSKTYMAQQQQYAKTRDQLVLLQNMTPSQGRKPDFRQSTTLPKSYKQFVATVNSGSTADVQSSTPGQMTEKVNMYRTAINDGFMNSMEQPNMTGLIKELIQPNTRSNITTSKKSRKQKKDDILKMINSLDVGENNNTFRNLAKKFYVLNIKQQQSTQQPLNAKLQSKNQKKQSPVASLEASSREDQAPPEDSVAAVLKSQSSNSKKRKGAEPAQAVQENPRHDEKQIKFMQRQLWQQFQLLRILKYTKYQQQLEKCQRRGDNTLPLDGPPGSQALEYGFDITEEEMYRILFGNPSHSFKGIISRSDSRSDKKDKIQPYASFECLECVQMASLMLEDEIQYYQNNFAKSKGKSRDSTVKNNGGRNSAFAQPLKGIAGLQTQGTQMKSPNPPVQRISDEDQLALIRDLHEQIQNKSQQRAQHQQILSGRRVQVPADDLRLAAQVLANRGQQQGVLKKQNANFRQIIRGEQMTSQAIKSSQPMQSTCTCRPGSYQMNNRSGRCCVCGLSTIIVPSQQLQQKGMYQQPAIPSMNSNRPQKVTTRKNAQLSQCKGNTHENSIGSQQHGHGHGQQSQGYYGHGQEQTNALDGTVAGHKRQFKPAIGIYQPPLQPFKHLAQSPINQVISKVNELVLILFKQRIKCSDQQIIKLFKYFGIPIPRGNGITLDTKAIRMPDFQHTVNQKLLIKLYKVLNNENDGIQPEQSTQIFRFYVGKGNNYCSVRQIISRRNWWNRGCQKQEKFYGQRTHFDDSTAIEEQQLMSSKQFSSGCHFIWTQWRKTEHHDFLRRIANDRSQKKSKLSSLPTLIYNRLEDNYHLSNKKALFLNVSTYYRAMGINPFEVAIPLTFNVKTPINTDSEYIRFTRAYKQYEKQKDANIWIIKPGENSNRGTGIQVASNFSEIRSIIQQLSQKNGNRTSIVQKYLDKPLLIHNRKFDIRGYALITSINGKLKGYMYRDCYFRTSSKQFDLTNLHSRYIHLTNDAIQMNSEDYGRYESGNKLSINDFQRYLDQNHGNKNVCFMRDLFPQMERLVTDSFRAIGSRIDPKRLSNCFEIFGYDFMIDENFKVFLIEANTNPCLEICSPLLARIIPELLDNSFRIALDPLYQPAQLLAKLKDDDAMLIVRERGISSCDIKGAAAECEVTSPVQKRQKQSSGTVGAAAQPNGALKRQRVEMLTQIKYTLIYDERIDKPVVDKILADFELKQRQSHDAESEIVTVSPDACEIADDDSAQMQLFREIVEEEKLDEQAAKKEEIEAAEHEAEGYLPQPLMLQPAVSHAPTDEEDDDEVESEDDDIIQ